MVWLREPNQCSMKYQKPWRNTQKVTDKEKRSKRLNEVRPFENINKNPHSLLDISSEQKKVSPSHKVQDHVQEEQNPFGSKEDNPTQRNCKNQLSHPSLTHISKNVRRKWFKERLICNEIRNSSIGKAKF